MPKTVTSPETIQKALAELKQDPIVTIMSVADKYGVPRSTLYRYHKNPNRTAQRGARQLLTEEEEKHLIETAEAFEQQRGKPIKVNVVQQIARNIHYKRTGKWKEFSSSWLRRFKEKYPNFKHDKQERKPPRPRTQPTYRFGNTLLTWKEEKEIYETLFGGKSIDEQRQVSIKDVKAMAASLYKKRTGEDKEFTYDWFRLFKGRHPPFDYFRKPGYLDAQYLVDLSVSQTMPAWSTATKFY